MKFSALVELLMRGGRSRSEAICNALESQRASWLRGRPGLDPRRFTRGEIDGSRTRVLVEQLGAIDHSRLGRSHGVLRWQELREIDDALETLLALGRAG